MIETCLTRTFGLSTPILSAGMAFVSRPRLAAAVSNAGGMGFVGADMTPPEGIARLIASTRELTSRPFGLDIMTPFFTDEHLKACLAEPVAVVNFIWGYPNWEWVEQLQEAGSQVWMKVTSLEEAKGALQCGLDGLIVEAPQAANGISSNLMSLLPEIVDAVRLPVIASGNIADGRSLAASLTLGAEAVRYATPFLAAVEADAEAEYERRFGPSSIEGTALVELFSPEWPEDPPPAANSRSTHKRFCPEVEERPIVAGPIPVEAVAAGHGLTLTKLTRVLSTEREVVFEQDDYRGNEKAVTQETIRPVAEIIRELTSEAEQVLARYAPLVAVA